MALMLEAPTKVTGRAPPPVRLAVPEDEDALFDLCWMVHQENALFPPSPRRAREELRQAILRQKAQIGVVGPVRQPVGMAWLVQHQEWYTDQVCIHERFVFVHPDHRDGTNHATDLLDWTRHIASTLQFPLVIGFLSNIRTAAKLRLYRQQFGDPVGYYFIHGQRGGKPVGEGA